MKRRSKLLVGDWFGCGRKITTESWNGFLAARKAYWEKKDKETKSPQIHQREQGVVS